MAYRNREEAGALLAERLEDQRGNAPVVVALPRGGVVVAAAVARRLHAPLDVLVVRKLGAPDQPEFGVGAIAEGGSAFLDGSTCAALGISENQIEEVAAREAIELQRRVAVYRGSRPPVEVRDRLVILIDDGVATGATARAAIRALRERGPSSILFATPIAAADSAEVLRAETDRFVALEESDHLVAIGLWYEDFSQVDDSEVVRLLAEGAVASGGVGALSRPANYDAARDEVRVLSSGVTLDASLVIPGGAAGLVLFAHGSGSGRWSPRNRSVAASLNRAGLATLLLDLLTLDEEALDRTGGQLRFDIRLLAERLIGAIDWLSLDARARELPIGCFGSSTGAAAALIAAAERPWRVRAVVSRGGRPDLAESALGQVRAPTLLIVGALDEEVLELNRAALDRLGCDKKLSIVPRATHLFEEPGALDAVSELAADWFRRWLAVVGAEARS